MTGSKLRSFIILMILRMLADTSDCAFSAWPLPPPLPRPRPLKRKESTQLYRALKLSGSNASNLSMHDMSADTAAEYSSDFT